MNLIGGPSTLDMEIGGGAHLGLAVGFVATLIIVTCLFNTASDITPVALGAIIPMPVGMLIGGSAPVFAHLVRKHLDQRADISD